MRAIEVVYSDRRYLLLSAVAMAALLGLYHYLLSSGLLFFPIIFNSLAAGKWFDIGGFIAVSALFSLSLAMQAYSFGNAGRAPGKGLTASALAAGVFTQVLCCSPILGSLFAVAGLSSSALFSTMGAMQASFAALEPAFLLLSVALLAASISIGSRVVLGCNLPAKKNR